MNWFNYWGLAFVIVIMIPNIIYAVKMKEPPEQKYKNKAANLFEQIGRYGCLAFMIFNIPYTYFNFWFDYSLVVYLSVNGFLCIAYLIFWIVCWNKNGKLKVLSLSIIPSFIFLFSGIVLASIALIIFAVIFATCHILISYKNT